MSIRGGPDIIEDGLQLYLDSQDVNSYVSGQYTKDLVTGQTFNGNDYSTASWANNISEITIFLWWKKIGNSTIYATWPVSKFNGSTSRASFVMYHFHNTLEGSIGWYGHTSNSGWTTLCNFTTMALNETAFMCLQYNTNNSGGQCWKNNQKIGGRLNRGNLGVTGSGYGGISITGGFGSSNSTTEVFSVGLYSRELQDNEIIQIYNATKGRYGL